jgi:hypothetical protein
LLLKLAGCLLALAAVPYLALPWYARLGTENHERLAALPGDAIVPTARSGYTLATTIRARPSEVWPWLLQMGQGRAGFYTHEWIENLLGADIHNADRIVPSLQHLAVGDTIRLTPDPYLGQPGQFITVTDIQPERALVFTQTLPNGATGTWALALAPGSDHTTRLLLRRRSGQPSFFDRVMKPGYVFMDRGMLQGIRQRVEAAARPHNRVER